MDSLFVLEGLQHDGLTAGDGDVPALLGARHQAAVLLHLPHYLLRGLALEHRLGRLRPHGHRRQAIVLPTRSVPYLLKHFNRTSMAYVLYSIYDALLGSHH